MESVLVLLCIIFSIILIRGFIEGVNLTIHNTISSTSVIFANLPTSAPATTGQLWNDSGTLKIA